MVICAEQLQGRAYSSILHIICGFPNRWNLSAPGEWACHLVVERMREWVSGLVSIVMRQVFRINDCVR